MKRYWTNEDKREYQRIYRLQHKTPKVDLIGPPKPKMCLCGRFGMVRKNGNEWVCISCCESERIDWHSNQINEDLAIARNISPAWLLRQLQAWQEEVKTWIEDKGQELVVHAHGEYHLQLQ
jgi:hypothetical protein